MSALRRKSNVALIAGVAIMVLLIPVWYMVLAPSMIMSQLEKIDSTTTFEGTFEYLSPIPVLITAHAYVEEVKGENILLKFETNATSYNVTLPELSGNSTYVVNKFSRENVRDAPEANKPREGYYDPLFPSHLKADEDIPKAWLDNLNESATLEFQESRVEEGVTLHKYRAEKTITKEMYVEGIGLGNVTLTATKTILIEPLSGLWVYTENETVYSRDVIGQLLYLQYHSTAESKAQGLANAKAAYSGMQLLELYIPMILGVIVVVLSVALIFNVRRLRRKKAA